jgi:TonB family protein
MTRSEHAIPLVPARQAHPGAVEDLLCLALGAGLTFLLFVAIAKFESVKSQQSKPEIEDVHMASAIFVPPPPKPEERTTEPEAAVPLAGIDVGVSESPVKVAVVPPDLQKIMPVEELPPKATIQFGQVMTELKPKIGAGPDFQHIYQTSEVDVPPKALVQTIARVPHRVRGDAEELRVDLFIVVDQDGTISSIRIVRPSGNSEFDEIVLDCVRDEWQFSPAIRKGKKVRCLIRQPVWYKWSGGSRFTI